MSVGATQERTCALVRVYVMERSGGGFAVVMTSSTHEGAKTLDSSRSQAKMLRVAKAVVESLRFAGVLRDVEVVGPLAGTPS